MKNTKACIIPTKSSRPKKGSVATPYEIEVITTNNTSPAKMLPNNLNENEINLPNSDTNSRIPTKILIGPWKLMYLPMYANLFTLKPTIFVTTTDINANAIPADQSAVGARNRCLNEPVVIPEAVK